MGFRHDHDCLTASRALVVLSLWFVLDWASRARAGGPAAELPPAAPRAVSFVRDVQALLARHCHACHGQNVQEGGLRHDQKAAALPGGNSGPAIVPLRSAKSRLVHYVMGLGAESIEMPPGGIG